MDTKDKRTTHHGTSDGRLQKRLEERGWEFDFFQAVWLLERYQNARVNTGERGPVSEEPFRFRPDVSMGFPATDITRITRLAESDGTAVRYQVEVTFMGLYGVSTPLPLHYATDILRSVEQMRTPGLVTESDEPGTSDAAEPPSGSTPVRDFLDLFHHRLISLFYRTWLKYRYDKSYGIAGRDVITDYLLWLIGCSRDYDASTLGVKPIRLLRYAGILTQRPRSATTLEGMLFDYWKVLPIQVHQCVGRWVIISPSDRNRIGVERSVPGENLTIGGEIYDLTGAFKVVVGLLDWETFLSFLPDGWRFAETRALVKHFCVDPLSFGLELKLRDGEVPAARLTSGDDACRLGFTSWLRTGDMKDTSVTFDATSAFRSQLPVETKIPPGAKAA